MRECLRPASFIPESKRLNRLLKEFRDSMCTYQLPERGDNPRYRVRRFGRDQAVVANTSLDPAQSRAASWVAAREHFVPRAEKYRVVRWFRGFWLTKILSYVFKG